MGIPSFITVRTSSNRLSQKCLLPFGNGNVLEHIIRRAKHYNLDAIICTSVDKSDDIIRLIAEKEDVKCFRGSMLNKLRRWCDCCDHFNIEKFHTVDADDPFFDGVLIKKSFIHNRYKRNVGYSGHEVGLSVSYAAAALGITSLGGILLLVARCMALIKLLRFRLWGSVNW